MKSKFSAKFILSILLSANTLIALSSALAEMSKCTKEVAKRSEFVEKSAAVIGKLYDGLPPRVRVTENSSQSYKKGRARFLYNRYLALKKYNTTTSHRTLCLPSKDGRDYVGTLMLIGNSLDQRAKSLKKRVKSGYNLDRNKKKIKELTNCSMKIEDELIPRTLDICEHARINIELEKLAITRTICNVLDPQHSSCKD